MRIILLFWIGILCSGCAYAGKKNAETIFTIAYPLSARFSEKTCNEFLPKETQSEYINVCMDAVLELEFELGDVFYGKYEGETVNVIDFVHSGGFPRYLTETSIYLVLIKEKHTYFLAKTAYLRDVGDEEWICGKDLNPLIQDASPKAPPYRTSKVSDCAQGVPIEAMKNYLKSIEP